MLGTEGLDEFNVLRLRAGLNEDAQVGLALVQSFGALAETTSKTIVACDANSLAFPRTTDQVLDIVYLNATGKAATKGGFYPNGMNGTITASTAASR